MTTDEAGDDYGAWHPDGTRVAYSSRRDGGPRAVWMAPVDGRGAPELLVSGDGHIDVEAFSRDGRMLAVHGHQEGGGGEDVLLVDLEAPTPAAVPLVADQFRTGGSTFSPDGRYLAYVSNVSGRFEVYVRATSGDGGALPVSVGGGREPVWAENGEIFYRDLAGERMMAVPVETAPALRIGTPEVLFAGRYFFNPTGSPLPKYDVTRDGQRFLMLTAEGSDAGETGPRIIAIQHWLADLARRVPVD